MLDQLLTHLHIVLKKYLYFYNVFMIFTIWLARKFACMRHPLAPCGRSREAPVRNLCSWGLGLGWTRRRLDFSILRLLTAVRWLRLSAGGWLMLGAGHGLSTETAGCVWIHTADNFTDNCTEGRLRRFVWGLTRSTPGGVGGFINWQWESIFLWWW